MCVCESVRVSVIYGCVYVHMCRRLFVANVLVCMSAITYHICLCVCVCVVQDTVKRAEAEEEEVRLAVRCGSNATLFIKVLRAHVLRFAFAQAGEETHANALFDRLDVMASGYIAHLYLLLPLVV